MRKLSYNYDQIFLVWDMETANLSLIEARPWELAFCLIKNNKTIYEYQAYIWNENLNMSAGAAAVTRFDYDYYKNKAQPAEKVHRELKKYINDPTILLCGHNIIGFDWPVYKAWAKSIGKWEGWKDYMERSLDTLLLSRIYNDNRKPDCENLFSSQLKEIGKPARGAKKANLSAMCKILGIEVDQTKTHGALYDIGINAKVLNQLIYKLEL